MKRLPAPEAAEQLGVKVATLNRWAARGDIVAAKVGRRWMFAEDDIEAFVDSRKNVTPASTRRRRRRAA